MCNKTPTCPKCKRKMVTRKGASGDFFGCSSFPRCRYTTTRRFLRRNIPQDLIDNVLPGNFNTRKG
ncbi:MAG: topoisomerase DNA-binding C4 zinc finger domain-containing protein [Cellvibrionaceae bacterium]